MSRSLLFVLLKTNMNSSFIVKIYGKNYKIYFHRKLGTLVKYNPINILVSSLPELSLVRKL